MTVGEEIRRLLEALAVVAQGPDALPEDAPPDVVLLCDLVRAALRTPALQEHAQKDGSDLSELLDLLALDRLVQAGACQANKLDLARGATAELRRFRLRRRSGS